MPVTRRTHHWRALAAGLAATLAGSVAPGLISSASAVGIGPDTLRTTTPGLYVVTLATAPAAAAVPPAQGKRFDRTRPGVRRYVERLTAAQDALLHRLGDPTVAYRYTTATNGFAAALTSDQVKRLRSSPDVLLVERSTKQRLDQVRETVHPGSAGVGGSSRRLLGLEGPDGVWARHGGAERAGRDVVVGVVDTGLWPDNPSFSGLPLRTPGTAPGLPGFHGSCAPAQDWSSADCTDKVVSARWFVRGFGAENVASAEHLSARDSSGHGSHVASVAAGDHGIRVRIDGQGFGTTSGMAPAARLAVYKACWTAPEPADDGCTTADTVAAVDRAVADGVDVLSYSVSGGSRMDDSVERAFLGAASAGVFVAASAGNDGGRGSVGHVAPWVTTVGASTHHVFRGTVALGDGSRLSGAMVSDRAVPRARLVRGQDVADPDATPGQARRCERGSLDAARAEGRIVVCERGDGARVAKSATVAAAGGVGMVLVNPRHRSTDADVQSVPTVHVDVAAGRRLASYLEKAGSRATASLVPAGRADLSTPVLAGFSARGPTGDGDVLKPDLTAPGVSVLGAVAPPSDSGRSWDLMSGTSTSAPHVAGLAAFVRGVHRDWSPARIRSAMMTTAYDVRGAAARGGPLAEGAGHVDPQAFLDPGLVFDTSPATWRKVAAGALPARDANAPSLAVGDLAGPTSVTRWVTNVSSRRESWSVRPRSLSGVDVQAFPATFSLAPGQTRPVRLRVSARPSARVDQDVTGWLIWSGDRHRVRTPVTVRPTVVSAPRQVDGKGKTGTVVVRGRSGNGRTVKLHTSGLVAARTTPLSLTAGAFDPEAPEADADTATSQVDVPAGTDVARFASTSGPGNDVDLYVFRDGALVDSSTASSPDAEVTLTDPEPGSYDVYVNAHHTTGDAPATGELATWLVPEAGGSTVRLSTDAVGFAPGKAFRYSASWQHLDPDRQYLGVVTYGDSQRRTLVEVN